MMTRGGARDETYLHSLDLFFDFDWFGLLNGIRSVIADELRTAFMVATRLRNSVKRRQRDSLVEISHPFW
jgi:hypothetical protein